MLLISRQGKVRLTKWYSPYTQKERTKVSAALYFYFFGLKLVSFGPMGRGKRRFELPHGPWGLRITALFFCLVLGCMFVLLLAHW